MQTDFGVGQTYLRDFDEKPVDPNKLQKGQQFQVKLSIYDSMNFFNTVPGGGSRIVFDIGFGLDFLNVPVRVVGLNGEDFDSLFKVEMGGQLLILEQVGELPKDFNATVIFAAQASEPVKDNVIKVEWLVTDMSIVADVHALNNYSSMYYTIEHVEEPLPTTTKQPEPEPLPVPEEKPITEAPKTTTVAKPKARKKLSLWEKLLIYLGIK